MSVSPNSLSAYRQSRSSAKTTAERVRHAGNKYRALLAELPVHLRGITCIAYHVANRKGELFRLEWSDVELDGKPPFSQCGRGKPRTTMAEPCLYCPVKCWIRSAA
jgi:hypothetical protein